MESQILRPNREFLAVFAIVLVVAAALALLLLSSARPAVIGTRPVGEPAVQTDVAPLPNAATTPDSKLPVCMRHGGPTC